MNLNQQIKSYINQHKKTKKRLSLAALLSLLTTAAVVSSLIMPAVSMTLSNAVGMNIGENAEIYMEPATPGTPSTINGMLDLMSANEFTANLSSGGNYFYWADETGVQTKTGFEASTDPVEISAYIKYSFTKSVKNYIKGAGPHLCWDLGNPNLTATFTDINGNPASSGVVTDPSYQNGQVAAGTYIIENGCVKVTLTDGYLNYVNEGEGTLEGAIEFSGSLGSSSSKDGSQTFNINDQKITVDFPNKYPTIAKNGSPDYSSGSFDNKINWEINIASQTNSSLAGYYIEDTNIPDSGVVLDPSEYTLSQDGNRWKIEGNSSAPTLSIKYQTNAETGHNYSNTAKLYKDNKDNNDIGTSSKDVTYTKPVTVDKSSNVDTNDGQVDWTIVVSNPYKIDLTGFTLTDNMLSSALSGTFSISPEVGSLSGNTITFNESSKNAQWITIKYSTEITADQLKGTEGSKKNTAILKKGETEISKDPEEFNIEVNPFEVTKKGTPDYKNGNYDNNSHKIKWVITVNSKSGVSLDNYIIEDANIPESGVTVSPSGSLAKSENDQWKLSGTNGANTVTITYEADATEKTNTNEAILKYPDGAETGKKGSDSVYYKSESELVSLSKSGNYNNTTHEISWTIDVNVEGGFNLNGYEISDSKFPANLDDLTFEPASVKDSVSLSGEKLTFGSYSGNVKIKYKTKVDMPQVSTTIDVTNDYGHNGTTQTATVQVPVRDQMTKNLSGSSMESVESSGNIIKVLNWNADIIHDGSFSGLTYTDNLTITGSNASHTITDAQIAAIKITAGVASAYEKTLTIGTDYTVTKKDDGTGFTITFKDTLDNDGINFVRISYSTTAKADSVSEDAPYPLKYTFGNGAGCNNNNSSGKFELTRNNPVIDERMVLNINKEWKSFPNISAAEFRILYTTDGGSSWKYVRKDSAGGYLFDGDSGYNSADYYTVSVNPSGTSGTAAVTDLPQTIRKANPDGSAGTTVYYKYKIAEVVNGSEITGNLVNVGNGNVYEVSYNNNYGIGYSGGTINVTNTYYTNRNITPKKNWTGDEGSGSGIDSVTVQLEYSVGSGYYPVKKSENGAYIFDNNSTAENVVQKITSDNSWNGSEWSNLPQKIVVNGNAVKCEYGIREIAYTLSGSTEPVEITNDRIILTNGYYEVSSGMSNDGNLTVTNKYFKTQNVSFSAVKSWAGDNSYLNGRPTEIYVQLTQYSSDGTSTPYGDLVKLSADTNWSYSWNDLPNQSITNGELITYSYKAAEVKYKYGDNTVDITGSYFASTNSGWYSIAYNYQDDKTQITNTFTPVSTISITPQKKWVGDGNFASTNRPQNVTLKLQRKLEGGSWEDCVGSDSNVITVTLSSTNNISNEWTTDVVWQGASIDNLPETIITIDSNGNYTKKSCVYRLVESAYKSVSGSDATLSDDAVSFKTVNGIYSITPDSNVGAGIHTVANKFEESIGIIKNIVDNNGNPISSIEKDDLINFKRKIGNTDYYVFNWVITYDGSDVSLIRPVSDILPEGFTLCEDSSHFTGGNIFWGISDCDEKTPLKEEYYNGYYAHPTMIWPKFGANYVRPTETLQEVWDKWENNDWYYYDKTINRVYFNKPAINPDATMYLAYATKIECEILDRKVANGSYSITNHAVKHEKNGTETEQTATATLKIANPVETNLLTKTYVGKTYIPGEMKFTMNVNPEGKNLSTGDTIDIEDIFDTVSYFDSDVGGGTLTTDSKLTDVIMSNIRLYEIDANDNRIELKPNQYSLMFENGSDVSGGSALLKLTIPDEKHIEIEYVYKIIANKKTPSVINQCKSSTRVNGRYVTMTPGLVPPANDKITFSNKAKLISDSATDESEVKNQEYVVSKSSGTISTDILPKIKKVNTGDYTINALSASFLFAKYENGKWFYATDITDGVVTWSSIGNDGTKISDDALKIDVQTAYEVELDETVLYKLVEVSVPDGYEGSNLGLSGDQFQQLITQYLNSGNPNFNGTNYQRFLDNYVSTYYFAYNSVLNSYPSGITAADVMQIKSGGDIEIPNNELIDIGITKEWVKVATDVTDSEVTVELYWSYTKDSTKIPNDAVLASADDLGIMSDSFTPTKTVPASANNAKLWTDLPNGKNSKPIYYYVKETGFKLGGTQYVLDTHTDEYISQSGNGISIKPTYSGNAANSDKVIGIRNSESLLLKKEWKNSSNEPMKNIPVSKVVVSIYGIDSTGTKTQQPLFENVELLATNNWTKDITEFLGSVDLSQYKSFVAEESTGSSLNGYVVSCVFNLNKSTGEIIVTNKNKTPTEASVSVHKVWSDGNDIHANESIKVTLYQSLQKLDDLTNLSAKLNSVASVMQKTDLDDPQTYENVILNAENDWSVTWTGLPLEDEDQNRYYYYVLEDKSGIANEGKYSESYSITSQTVSKTDYIITNTRNAIVVQKNWFDEDSNTVPDNELPVSEIVLDVLKKVPSVPSTGIKLVAFGDSITDGYGSSEPNCSKNGKDYPSKLVALLRKSKYTITNGDDVYSFNKGESQQQIGGSDNDGFRSRVTNDIPSDTNIVCFLGGTNDIHQSGSSVRGNPDGVYERFVACIEKIKTQAPNAVIFVGSIPHFDFYKNGNLTEGGNWWNWLTAYSDNDGAIPNGYIDQYNARIKAYAETTDGVYFVDVCRVVTDDKIRNDGCHPNEAGYDAIANEYYQAITSYYTQTSAVGQITLSAANNWMGTFDIADGDPNAKYYVNESSVPSGWVVTYNDQYQQAGSSTPIKVTNTRNTPKTSITVEKTWKGDTSTDTVRNNIKLILLRSIDRSTWEECDVVMPDHDPDETGNIWTYTYEDLPAEDNLGNKYWYKVEELPLAGYTTGYENYVLEAKSGTSAGTMKVINTRAISLRLKKLWSDIDTNHHLNDEVILNVYRSVTKADAPADVDLILELDKESVGVTAGSSTDVKANKVLTGIEPSEGSDSFFSAGLSADGKTVTITGISEGSGSITVTDGTDTKTINVTVSAYKLLCDDTENYTITAGENTHRLTVTKSGSVISSGIKFNSLNESVLTVSDDGIITTVNAGTADVQVKLDGNVILKQTITVNLPADFKITGENEVVIGSDIQLGIDNNYGTFTWRSSSDAIATVDQTGKVTGVADGTVTITAKRNDGLEKTLNITVIGNTILKTVDYNERYYYPIPEEARNNVVSISIEFADIEKNIDADFQLYDNNNNKVGSSWISNNNKLYNTTEWQGNSSQHYRSTGTTDSDNFASPVSHSNNIISWTWRKGDSTKPELYKIEFYNKPNNSSLDKLVIKNIVFSFENGQSKKYYKDPTQTTSLLSTSNSTNSMLLGAGDAQLVKEVKLSGASASENPWEYVLEDLDVYDSSGRPYIYWVEEASANTGYDVSYQFSDGSADSDYYIDATAPDAGGGFAVTVRNTKNQQPGVTLPNTGGEGVMKYYYTGGAIIALSLFAGSFRFRRRLKERRTK